MIHSINKKEAIIEERKNRQKNTTIHEQQLNQRSQHDYNTIQNDKKKKTKTLQYNIIQHITIHYNTLQYNTIE